MQNSSDYEANDASAGQSSQDQLISGEARINLFPRSHFPLSTFIDISDSRVETDTVGVALEDITTLRRERFGFTQQYRPKKANSNYSAQFIRTRVLDNDGDGERTDNAWASASERYGKHSLNYSYNVRDAERDEAGTRLNDRTQAVAFNHGYRPDKHFSIDSVVNVTRAAEQLDAFDFRENATSSLDTSLTWQPVDSSVTVRAQGGLNRREQIIGGQGMPIEDLNSSASVSYDITNSLHFRGDVGLSRTRSEGIEDIESKTENTDLNYAPLAVPLGSGVKYHWAASANVGNKDTSGTESVQSVTLGARHGLDRIATDTQGTTKTGESTTTTISFNQSVTQFRDSSETDLLTLNHLGSGAVQWVDPAVTNRVQANVSDSRTSGTETTLQKSTAVDNTVRSLNLLGSTEVRTSRRASWNGQANFGRTRDNDGIVENRFVFSQLSGSYTHGQAFDVEKLRFRSRLEYAARRSEFGPLDSDTERRASWDNRLDWTVGLLRLGARRTMTDLNGNTTVVHVLSASRSF